MEPWKLQVMIDSFLIILLFMVCFQLVGIEGDIAENARRLHVIERVMSGQGL